MRKFFFENSFKKIGMPRKWTETWIARPGRLRLCGGLPFNGIFPNSDAQDGESIRDHDGISRWPMGGAAAGCEIHFVPLPPIESSTGVCTECSAHAPAKPGIMVPRWRTRIGRESHDDRAAHAGRPAAMCATSGGGFAFDERGPGHVPRMIETPRGGEITASEPAPSHRLSHETEQGDLGKNASRGPFFLAIIRPKVIAAPLNIGDLLFFFFFLCFPSLFPEILQPCRPVSSAPFWCFLRFSCFSEGPPFKCPSEKNLEFQPGIEPWGLYKY